MAPEADAKKLEKSKRRTERGGLVRRAVCGLLVVLFAVLLPLTASSAWTHRTVLDTDTYVSTLAPVASDPAVIAAVSRQITNELYAALDPQATIADALPPKATFLAGPIANAARNQVQQAVSRVLASDRFQQLWTSVNRFAHQQVVAVLRGDKNVLQTTNGVVVLNFVPLFNAALANASQFVSGVVGRQINIPTVSATELPSAACARISAALGRPLPATCGQIPLFRAASLTAARRGVQIFDRAVLGLLIVTPLVFLGAIWLSRRRRRTLLQLTLGGMLGLVVVRRALLWEQDQLVNTGRAVNKDARSAIVHQLLGGFFDLTMWLLVGGLVIVALALVTGPYRWAVATRRGLAVATHRGRVLVSAAVNGTIPAEDQATVAWAREHFDILRLGGGVVAFLLLLSFSVNFWGLLAIAALLVVYEVGLYRLRPPDTVTLPAPRTEQPPTDGPAGGAGASGTEAAPTVVSGG